MNFMGLAFFLPMFLSAIITSILFMSHDRNISIAEENFQKEKALTAIQSQAMENRIYEEINSLTHDLKTPLVTIRGLNSLLSISKDIGKIGDYTDRIESAVGKMSEMISSFLYDSSRQLLNVDEVVQYVRAQIPVEDERLNIEINAQRDLPSIYVNKIRVVRALINLIENAIVVPYAHDFKEIKIDIIKDNDNVLIIISDNGIGISKEKLDKIWITGYSLNQTSGLGLSFAKKVIEDNEGTIDLKSEEGIGTIVTVSFPGHSS
jgi:signal transduction histidine kinase